jgi:hypothetical protein
MGVLTFIGIVIGLVTLGRAFMKFMDSDAGQMLWGCTVEMLAGIIALIVICGAVIVVGGLALSFTMT